MSLVCYRRERALNHDFTVCMGNPNLHSYSHYLRIAHIEVYLFVLACMRLCGLSSPIASRRLKAGVGCRHFSTYIPRAISALNAITYPFSFFTTATHHLRPSLAMAPHSYSILFGYPHGAQVRLLDLVTLLYLFLKHPFLDQNEPSRTNPKSELPMSPCICRLSSSAPTAIGAFSAWLCICGVRTITLSDRRRLCS
jgi:hypothetical protein